MRVTAEKSQSSRKRWLKRVRPAATLLALAALLTALVAGCGSSSSSSSSSSGSGEASGESASADSGQHVNMAMFLVSTANTHQQAALKGAEKAVAEDGNASLHAYNGNFDPTAQSNQIEDATAGGQYDAFLVDSVDGTQTIPAITKALNEGITVVCGFSICGPDQEEFAKQLPVAAEIASDYVPVGEAEGRAIGKGCEGKDPCNIVYIRGVPALAADVLVTKGIENALKDFPNVKIVATGEGLFEAGASYKAMKTILQAHPDIDGVVSDGDQMINGAAQAIEESPLKDKNVLLVGDGASVIGVAGIKAGVWYASAILRPFNEGYLEAQYAMAAVRGEPMSPDLVDTTVAPDFPEGYVDAENVDKWKPEWAG